MSQGLTQGAAGITVSRMFALRLTPHSIFPARARAGVAVAVVVMDVMDAPPDRIA